MYFVQMTISVGGRLALSGKNVLECGVNLTQLVTISSTKRQSLPQ